MTDIVQRLRYRLDHGNPVIIGYSDPDTPLDHDIREAADTIDAERALADDLADALRDLDDGTDPEIAALLARYRQARGR